MIIKAIYRGVNRSSHLIKKDTERESWRHEKKIPSRTLTGRTMRLKDRRRIVTHTKPSRAYLEQLQTRYAKARKQARTKILDEFVETTPYERK